MPAAHPRVLPPCGGLARLREKPIAQIAKDIRDQRSCLRRWMGQADVEESPRRGLTKTSVPSWFGCAGRNGSWRWKWRFSNGPAPISPGRISSQNSVPAGPRACR